MSRISVRVEDFLAGCFAIALVLFAGVRAAVKQLRLDEGSLWDFSYILAPLSLLVFMASVRYAFGAGDTAVTKTLSKVGRMLRDWLPFLLFLIFYEAFRTRIWAIVLPKDQDASLLAWDRRLFGETPAITLEKIIFPLLTDLLSIAYFTHLLLPPLLAYAWYVKNRRIFREFLLGILVAGILASIGYLLVPAVGPAIAFQELFHVGLKGEVYRPVTTFLEAARAPRDVFPSLHVAISTIVLWYAARLGRVWFFCFLPFVVANWFSTVYLRYHYLVDVFAGWLLAVLVVVLARTLLRAEGALSGSAARQSLEKPS